jgi:hypothetical protein
LVCLQFGLPAIWSACNLVCLQFGLPAIWSACNLVCLQFGLPAMQFEVTGQVVRLFDVCITTNLSLHL